MKNNSFFFMKCLFIREISLNNANNILYFDESLFTHRDGIQAWVVGIINTDINEMRLEVVANRNEEMLKALKEKHIGIGNIVYTDSWDGYNFLNRPNSGYNHNVVKHSHGIFGLTSRIEGI